MNFCLGHGDYVVRALPNGREDYAGIVENDRLVCVHEKRTVGIQSDQGQRNGIAVT